MIMPTIRLHRVRAQFRSRWLRGGFAVFLLLMVSMIAAPSGTSAQAGGLYNIVWSAVTAAATAQAGPYQADSTIGQSEVGAQSGGPYVLGGGFWGNTTAVVSTPQVQGATLYLPAIAR